MKRADASIRPASACAPRPNSSGGAGAVRFCAHSRYHAGDAFLSRIQWARRIQSSIDFLEDFIAPPQEAPAVAPRPRFPREPRQPRPIARASLLQALVEKTARVSPTSLESYLQCGFQYFGRQTLKLQTHPPRPDQRLDFMLQGNIVHEVLARWWVEGGDIATVFDEAFARSIEEHRIPAAYHTERLRNAMLDDLLAFAADTQWPRGQFRSRTEERIRYALADGTEIRGKIDRLDEAADGRAFVFDYKYSNAQNTRRSWTTSGCCKRRCI